jgi:hypothetical protein
LIVFFWLVLLTSVIILEYDNDDKTKKEKKNSFSFLFREKEFRFIKENTRNNYSIDKNYGALEVA